MRWLLRITTTLALIVVLFIGVCIWAVSSESGSKQLWNIAQSFTTEGLSLGEINGPLTGPLTIEGFELDGEASYLAIGRTRLDWNLKALLQRRLHILQLDLSDVTYEVRAVGSKSSDPFDPSSIALPFNIDLDTVSLVNLNIVSAPGATPLVIDHANLSASLNADTLTLRHSSLSSPLIDLNVATTIAMTEQHIQEGSIDWVLRLPDLAPMSGKASLAGPMHQLPIKVALSAPYSLNAEITITDTLSQPQLVFALNAEALSLSSIRPTLPAIVLTGKTTGQHDVASNTTEITSNLTVDDVPEIGRVVVALNGDLQHDLISIKSLVVNTPDHPVQLNGVGSVTLGASAELDFNIDWQHLRWPLSGNPLFQSPSGKVVVTGPTTSPTLSILGDVSTPVDSSAVSLKANIDLGGTHPTISLQSSIPDFTYPVVGNPLMTGATATVTLDGTLPNLVSDTTLVIGNTAAPPTLRTTSKIDLTDSQKPLLDLSGNWRDFAWPIVDPIKQVRSAQGTFTLQGTAAAFSANIAANINTDGKLRSNLQYQDTEATLTADWSDLVFDTLPTPVSSEHGRLSITGLPEDYQFVIDTDVAASDKRIALKTQGNGSLSAVDMTHITIDALDGQVRGNARVAWQSGIEANAAFTADKINPEGWFPAWPGEINAAVDSSISMQNTTLNISRLNLSANGELRDYPVNLSMIGSKLNNTFQIDKLTASSGTTVLNAEGTVADSYDLNWQLQSDSLQSLHPNARGALKGGGYLKGKISEPILEANLSGTDIAFKQNILQKIELDAYMDSSNQTPSDIKATLNGKLGTIDIQRAALDIAGRMSSHDIQLDAKTSLGRLQTSIGGRLADLRVWDFSLNTLNIENPQYGSWALTKPSQGRLSKQEGRLGRTCLGDAHATFCLDGQRNLQGFTATTAFESMPLATFLEPVLADAVLAGTISGDGSVQWDGQSDPIGDFTLTNSAGQLALTGDTDDPQKLLVFEPGKLTIDLDSGEATATLDLPLAGKDKISGQAKLQGSNADWGRRSLQSTVEIKLADIGFLQDIAPEIDQLRGGLHGSMSVMGTIDNPVFQGDIQLNDAQMGLAGPEILFENIHVGLTGDPRKGMNVKASAVSGGGDIDIFGTVNIAAKNPQITLVIKGDRVQVLNTPQAMIYVSPDVEFTLADRTIRLNGTMAVPEADIVIKEIPATAVNPSKDQIFVGKSDANTPREKPLNLYADIETTLGDRVNFSGFGLTARFGGALKAIEQPGKPSSLKGEIKLVDGRYKAYGQNLDIETGRLLFSGAEGVEPQIDLRATRQPTKDVRVGVTARGQIQEPEFSLFSSPSMTERNKLSYLLLGRAADQTTGGEKSQLGQLALAFGLGQTEGLTGSIKDKLGVDTIGVETEPGTDAEQESFVLGKYLTPNLYLRYGVGLFEPINTLRLQYSINEHWRAVTESSGKASGGDVFYSIERGD